MEIKVNKPAFHRNSELWSMWDGIVGLLVSLELWSAAVVKMIVISLTFLGSDLLFSSSPWRTLHHWSTHDRAYHRSVQDRFLLQEAMHSAGEGDEGHWCFISLMYTQTPRWVLTHPWTPASTNTKICKWPLRFNRHECALYPPSVSCIQFFSVHFAPICYGHCIVQ